MTTFNEVKEILRKILWSIYEDRNKLSYSSSDGGLKEGKITAQRFGQATDNHLFDDNPDLFGISEYEGHCVRHYFWNSVIHRGSDFVSDLHRNFPEIMDFEESKFLKDLNEERKKKGLSEIVLY